MLEKLIGAYNPFLLNCKIDNVKTIHCLKNTYTNDFFQ